MADEDEVSNGGKIPSDVKEDISEQVRRNDKIRDWVQKATQSAEVVDKHLEELENKYGIASDSMFRQILLEKVTPPVPPEAVLGGGDGGGIAEMLEDSGETPENNDETEDVLNIPQHYKDLIEDDATLSDVAVDLANQNGELFEHWLKENTGSDEIDVQDIDALIKGLTKDEQAEMVRYIDFQGGTL